MHASPLLRSARASVVALLVTLAAGGCAGSRSAAPDFIPPTRPAQFSMVGMPWDVSRDSTTALIEPRGYNFNSTDGDGDMWFDGVLLNTPTRLFAFMAGDSLVKIRLRLVTPDENALAVYAKARAELVKLYGQPQESAEEFSPPYAKGKNAEAAVKSGKATINAHWTVGTGRRRTHVSVFVPKDLVVVIDYEGPGWNREYVKRRRAAAD